MPKIAILDDYTNQAREMGNWNILPEDFQLEVFTDNLVQHDALVERLRDFEIICAMRERTPFPAALFERLENLKLFITTGMRNASVDVAAAKARGVTVCGTTGSAWATAELTWALLQACARNLIYDDRMMRKGRWITRIGVELRGKTLGIIGLGNLGGRVAKYAKSFGMKVIAWSQNLTEQRCRECNAELVDKESLFRESDFVTIHLVLSDRSRGLVSANDFTLMKPTAYLINTSRGPIVNEIALIAALDSGRIAGAAVDVYNLEPLPSRHRLRSLENLIMTPHTGYVTKETYRIFHQQMIENIISWHAGNPMRELS